MTAERDEHRDRWARRSRRLRARRARRARGGRARAAPGRAARLPRAPALAARPRSTCCPRRCRSWTPPPELQQRPDGRRRARGRRGCRARSERGAGAAPRSSCRGSRRPPLRPALVGLRRRPAARRRRRRLRAARRRTRRPTAPAYAAVADRSEGSLASGTLEVDGDEGTLTVASLPPTERDEVYQAWVQTDGQGGAVEPSSVFVVARRRHAATSRSRTASTTPREVMVTREPEGGSEKPHESAAAQRRARVNGPLRPRARRDLGSRAMPTDHLLPPPRPRDRRRLLALRAADLPRLHDPDLGRDALPRVRGRQDRRSRTPTFAARRGSCGARATLVLIGINVAVFVLEIADRAAAASAPAGSVFADGALCGNAIGDGGFCARQRDPRSRATAASGGASSAPASCTATLIHLALNMFALYILGQVLEPAIGTARFVAVYFVALIAGSVGALLLSDPTQFTVGASGAVYGLFLATICHRPPARHDPGGLAARLLARAQPRLHLLRCPNICDRRPPRRPRRRRARRRCSSSRPSGGSRSRETLPAELGAARRARGRLLRRGGRAWRRAGIAI